MLSPYNSICFLQSQNGNPVFLLQSEDCNYQADTFVGRMLTVVLVFLLKTVNVSRSVSVVVEDDSGE